MECKKCGKPVEDGQELCPECAAKEAADTLKDAAPEMPAAPDAPEYQAADDAAQATETAVSVTPEKADGPAPVVVSREQDGSAVNKKTVILICAVVAVIIAFVVGFFVIKNKGKKPGAEIESAASPSGAVMPYHGAEPQVDVGKLEELLTDENGEQLTLSREAQSMIAEATTTLSENVGTQSGNKIDEGANAAITRPAAENNGGSETPANTPGGSAETPVVNTADTEQADAAQDQIRAFLNRSCYLDGAMYDSGQGSPMSMSFHGDDYEAMTNIGGIEVAILKLGDQLYMKRPATKSYVVLNENVLSTLGLNVSDLSINFGGNTFEDVTPVAIYDVTVNGKAGVCYQYPAGNGGYSKFYAVDGNLVQINIADETGSSVSELQISHFSKTIPSDQLTIKGYTETSLGAMMADMGEVMQ